MVISAEAHTNIPHAHNIIKEDIDEMLRCAAPSCEFSADNENELVIKYGTYGKDTCPIMKSWRKGIRSQSKDEPTGIFSVSALITNQLHADVFY